MGIRKQEDVRLIRSDNLQYVQNSIRECINLGYELMDTKIFGEQFIAIMVKYVENQEPIKKESDYKVSNKKPKTVKYTELQIPKQP